MRAVGRVKATRASALDGDQDDAPVDDAVQPPVAGLTAAQQPDEASRRRQVPGQGGDIGERREREPGQDLPEHGPDDEGDAGQGEEQPRVGHLGPVALAADGCGDRGAGAHHGDGGGGQVPGAQRDQSHDHGAAERAEAPGDSFAEGWCCSAARGLAHRPASSVLLDHRCEGLIG